MPGDVAAGEGLGFGQSCCGRLAQGAATAGQKRLDQLDSDVLGDRDEANVAGPASAPHGRFGNPSFDFRRFSPIRFSVEKTSSVIIRLRRGPWFAERCRAQSRREPAHEAAGVPRRTGRADQQVLEHLGSRRLRRNRFTRSTTGPMDRRQPRRRAAS